MNAESPLGRIATAYVPLTRRIAGEFAARQRTCYVGLCGAQGSGKSTLARILQRQLVDLQLRTAVLSLDDLYFTRDERVELARRVHPLLGTRGVPGTHDIALGMQTFDALAREGSVSLPAFDKATDDRRPQSTWTQMPAPVDVVLFEGWCVGAKPQTAAALVEPINDLERDEDTNGIWRKYVNDALAGEYQSLFGRLDMMALLAAPSFEVVYAWRTEQEHALRQRLTRDDSDTSRLMNDTELERFIAYYERLTRHILDEMPGRADVVIELDATRTPVRTRGI